MPNIFIAGSNAIKAIRATYSDCEEFVISDIKDEAQLNEALEKIKNFAPDRVINAGMNSIQNLPFQEQRKTLIEIIKAVVPGTSGELICNIILEGTDGGAEPDLSVNITGQ